MTNNPSSSHQTNRTIRAAIKSLIESMGLLPLYRSSRKQVRTFFHFIGLLPLRILIGAGMIYTKIMWRINPEFKASKNYLTNVLGRQKTTAYHSVNQKDFTFEFYTPNSVCQFRADSLSTKEPETLEWMDEFGKGGALYDIGANVGVYSVYYAKTQNASVIAFEPSVFNLPTLVKNINVNNLESKIKVVVNPLSSECGFAEFKLPSTEEGGALNGFGVDYGNDGGPLSSVISYGTYGVSLDHLIEVGALKEKPSIIKIDVDGIEHLILEGARKTLSDPVCRSVLVEINGNFLLQVTKIKEILTSCGFVFKYKKRAAIFDSNGADSGTFNHIWVKE